MADYLIEDEKPQESLSDLLLRNLKSTGQRVGQSAEFLATLPFELPAYAQDLYKYATGEESPIQKQLRAGGMPIEHRQPYFQPEPAKNLTESVIQQTLADIPFLAATGGLQALKGVGTGAKALATNPIVRSLLGNIAGETAAESGAGVLGQTGARVAADVLHGRLTRPSLGQKATEAYGAIKPLGNYGMVSKEPLNESLKFLEQAYDVAIEPGQKNLLKNLYDSINTGTSGNKIDLRKMFDVRTELGKNYKNLSRAGYGPLAHDLREGINKAIRGEEAKVVNPKFWNAITEGDRFKIADNVRTTIADKFEDFVEKLPKLPGNVEKSLNAVTELIRQPEKFVRYMGNPTFRKHYIDFAYRPAEKRPTDILKHVNKLAKFSEEKPSKQSEWIIE